MWEFVLHILCCLDFLQRVSLTHPFLFLFSSGELLLHIPCWLQFYLESFSNTSRAGFNLISRLFLTQTMPIWFPGDEFLLHIPCWLHFYLGNISYTSRVGFIYLLLGAWGGGGGLLHIPCWLLFFNLGSFSYTSDAGFFFFSFSFLFFFSFLLFIWGVSLTHLMLTLFLCEDFLLHTPRCLHLLCGEFLLHIPCWFCFKRFYRGSFSYTSRAAIIFMQEVSLIHPLLNSF